LGAFVPHGKTYSSYIVSLLGFLTVWFRRHRRRLVGIGIGHTIYATYNFFFDQVLYVYVVHRMGLLKGGALMTLLAMTSCVVTLLLYERMRIDWVGAGCLAQLKADPHPAWWKRVILWAARKGSVVMFFALSIFQDPFVTTAYFRMGNFNGLGKRDWQVLFASGLVSNFYWTLRSGAVAAVLFGAWEKFKNV